MHADFPMRIDGHTLGEIFNWLHKNRIPSPTDKAHWSRRPIYKPLRNGKYVGDVLLQKIFVQEFLLSKQIKNNGKLKKFLMPGYHPPIVSRKLFAAANQAGRTNFGGHPKCSSLPIFRLKSYCFNQNCYFI